MKKLIVLLLFASLTFAQSTSKYFIYFKDKGVSETAHFSKTSAKYSEALNSLSEKSIKRRIKSMGKEYITYEDLPVNKQYIVKVKGSGAEIVWTLKWLNAVSAFLTDEQYQEISRYDFVKNIESVKKTKQIKEKIEAKGLKKTSSTSETKYKYDYGASLTQYELSEIPIVHDAGFTGTGVTIGILDAGFWWENHPALQNNKVLAERDFVYGDNNTDDNDASHGTAVFSLVGGFAEGNIVAPAFNAQFVLAKTEDVRSETHSEEDNYAAAMEWMDSIGVDITTTSLGYNEFDSGEGNYSYSDMDGKTTVITKVAELAFSRGILTVTSAGNEGNNSWKYITAPADGFNTISVGAVKSNRILASFSSRGPTYDGRIKPEVVAQGSSCYHANAYSKTEYGYGGGTSYSGPIVAGIAGQLLSAYPHLNNEQMRSIIIEACDSTEKPNNDYGYGLLSAKRAVEFPNLKKENGNYTLNKIVLDENMADGDSLTVGILEGKADVGDIYIMKKNGHYFSLTLPSYQEGEELTLLFSVKKNGDSNIPIGGNYKFKYGSLDIVLGIKDVVATIPETFSLGQNYPNPFNPSTYFVLSLPQQEYVTVNIYNILGEKVRTLVSKNFSVGNYKLSWDGTNDFGGKVASGVYIYTAISKNNLASKKLIYLR